MWWFVVAAFAGETRLHPTTGEPHTFVLSGGLSFDHTASPIYPPEALADASLPADVTCSARLWSRADGTVETVELLECPDVFRPLSEAALQRYVFRDPHAAAPEPLVTEVAIEFTRPGPSTEPAETVVHPVTHAPVPVVVRPKVLSERRPVSTSDDPVTCTATMFVGPKGLVDTVSVDRACPWQKPVVRAAMRWRFEPWGPDGTPTAFAVIEEFELDP